MLSFYPLVNDVEQLKYLDGWLLNAVSSAIKRRQFLLSGLGFAQQPSLDHETLKAGIWYDHDKVTRTDADGHAEPIINNGPLAWELP